MSDVIDAKKLMKIGMRGYKDTIDVNWHGVIIKVKYMLDMDEEHMLIQSIMNCCMTNDGNFVPELLDISIRANIVKTYSSVELPEDISEQHKLLYYSDLFDTIVNNVNKNQTEHILKLVELRI